MEISFSANSHGLMGNKDNELIGGIKSNINLLIALQNNNINKNAYNKRFNQYKEDDN